VVDLLVPPGSDYLLFILKLYIYFCETTYLMRRSIILSVPLQRGFLACMVRQMFDLYVTTPGPHVGKTIAILNA